MTVYFIKPLNDQTRFKVGETSDVERRIATIAGRVEGGVELVATIDGGVEIETMFHAIFAPDWIEGEWYKSTDISDRIISAFGNRVTGRRYFGRFLTVRDVHNSKDMDRQMARDALERIVNGCGTGPIGRLLTQAFEKLHAVNPLWTDRRVRGIWASECSRIEAYEMRDLETLATDQIEGLRSLSGRVDLP